MSKPGGKPKLYITDIAVTEAYDGHTLWIIKQMQKERASDWIFKDISQRAPMEFTRSAYRLGTNAPLMDLIMRLGHKNIVTDVKACRVNYLFLTAEMINSNLGKKAKSWIWPVRL